MKRLLYLTIFILCIDLSFHQCANPGRPTGGPKDTIPPTLTYESPVNGTTNFNGEVIELQFSEFVNADKLKQKLIITPKTDLKYKSIVKRNKLIIKLESPLKDSTTYNFNFADGLTDITEKNPAVNLSLAFSTGDYIDSMSVKGTVEELLTKEPGKGHTVGLYPNTDTLDYFTQTPMYFTTANDSGIFRMNYLKTGIYKILAFNDDNNNLLLDPGTESHGFLEESILLDSAISLKPLKCILQNVKPIQLINARPAGRYVEAKFNKMVDSYSIQPAELSHNIIGENNDIIRIYKSESINYSDSITSIIQASDSLGNEIIDTVKIVFFESNRKPSGFSLSTDPSTIALIDNPKLLISFNKPVLEIDTTKILIKADSIFSSNPKFSYQWNFNKTDLTAQIHFIADSLIAQVERSIPKDTTKTDSTSSIQTNKSAQRKLELILEKGAFISIENDTSQIKSLSIQEPKESPKGVLNITANTNKPSFIIQLLSSDKKVAYQSKDQTNVSFATVKPGNYKIRVLIDTNNDGKWTYGNLLKNDEPEEVYLHPGEISVRENWKIDLSITF
ncbi:MAG: Ig-like domain-containing protein [Ekhidna sp.]|uniref:Ig-like domain-containing protein n=1 Tax=Ekhidna sp. TaxID=2608089 RepID=UPI0032EF9048